MDHRRCIMSLFPRLRDVITLDPKLTIWADFLLPDWNNFFQAINAITCGFKDPRVAMRGSAGDQYRRRLRIEFANALDNGNPLHSWPFLADFLRDLFHLGFGHWDVCFVFKILSLMLFVTTGLAAHHASKDRGRARACQSDLCQQVV